MTKEKFEYIKNKYGHYASWAIYSKNKIYDLSIFEDKDIHKKVNPNVVFLGLNISGPKLKTLSNFHGTKDSHHNTLRFSSRIKDVFKETKYYGGYMTDIIKNFEEPDSSKVNIKDSKFTNAHIETFKRELNDICDVKTIIAFGGAVQYLLKKYKFYEKYNIINVWHYSYVISDEKYIKELKKQLSKQE